ncbi:hypothetical protein EG832_00020 [bacterium]|nr:hypothetical protein [bacterium]
MPTFLLLLTIVTRLPFTSKYIYHIDSGLFVLALQYYLRFQDRNIAVILKGLSTFNPKTTALFIGPYSFYSYRYLML